jgi:hypothetical protein
MDRPISMKMEEAWLVYVLLLMLTMRLEWKFSKYSKIAMLNKIEIFFSTSQIATFPNNFLHWLGWT